MSRRPIYLPIELQDVFELIADGKLDSIYFENGSRLESVRLHRWEFKELGDTNFYVKQEYVPKSEQEVPL
ncbi:TPA: hypothetical protein IUW01_000675 [Enterococcus faecalis]|nr:hypothetical protein [Enterococcus faecalis]EKE4892084.1 hypothetical protein [Enterococcus faecalis]HAP4442114.1 hypothetical protein [Enterococcus faecalis]HAP4463349.1 hypothetical protein [Enterococcus faecalis]HBI1962474.1 hypothetical protein [Enterococcus faecalis]